MLHSSYIGCCCCSLWFVAAVLLTAVAHVNNINDLLKITNTQLFHLLQTLNRQRHILLSDFQTQ